ncbi:Stk1 family PASTA domain-containing Ser/Thr kinase [Staphylococcus canis]|uniref:non-specific serine/threonine protein kinase n=1 Tax=Staphylococcus canis TaxID=2724942 RepID=A0ABS0T744_9STAP|nr:Stk1 family PASTA domain-containing Ser/Thr kinase [Staphylococcus canis]MBI5974564.1 Stk1 family PASTA domain-containing Ser/Thr kinase [Staphylococcus canis]
MIGRRIDERYELKQLLGGGGMSNVYIAWDIILERTVALKVINIPPNEKDETVKRFEREVQSTTLLSHENIVSVLDVGEEEDCFFLVMEYIEGPTLAEYIKAHGPLEPKIAIQLFNQILKGIQHAHAKGIIHRDIKPQNMMINQDHIIKIVDFGIAKALSETAMTQTNHVVGTVQYLSPEQAKGEKTGERSDIYALGIVLYEMLIGDPPFKGETPVSIAIKQIQEAIPNASEQRSEIPQALSNVILKATEKDPSERYHSISEMSNDVLTSLDESRINEKPYFTNRSATKTIKIDKQAIENENSQKHIEETSQIPIVPTERSSYKQSKQQSSKPKRSLGKKIWFSLIFFLLIAGLLFFMVAAMTGNKYSQIPNVTGQTLEEAQKTLEQNHLKTGKITEVYSDKYDKNHVMYSSPKQDEKVRQQSQVDLTVSKGPHIEKMPHLIGLPRAEAENKLKALGFEKISYDTAYTESDIAKGNIEAQSIAASTDVHVTQDEVVLTESLGKKQVHVGDYTNQNYADVKAQLEEKGLIVTVEKTRNDKNVEADHIISHSPKNQEVDEGTEIKMIISTGPKESDSPKTDEAPKSEEDNSDDEKNDIALYKQYYETFVIPYSGKDEKPQKVEIVINDQNHQSQQPAETFTITKDTSHTVNLQVEPKKTASYTVKVDGKTVTQQSINYSDI